MPYSSSIRAVSTSRGEGKGLTAEYDAGLGDDILDVDGGLLGLGSDVAAGSDDDEGVGLAI